MEMRIVPQPFGWTFRLMRILFASTLFILSIAPSWTLAQSADGPWAEPLNLSHSGVAVNPAIVIDSDAMVHTVWQDDLANFVYARFDGDQWSAPETTDLNLIFRLPAADEIVGTQVLVYTGPNPLFVAGPGRYIFAVWLSPEGNLFTSRVENNNFKNASAWNPGKLIAPDVASFAVAIDALGELHLAFLGTDDDPANPSGIYYTRSRSSGSNWAAPLLLYESPYLRTLGEGEANISLTTARVEDLLHVYIAWDNRPRKQVFLARSVDGGGTWEQPMLVAGPAPGTGLAGPFNIHVGADRDRVVLVWQSGRSGGACSQIYRSSDDSGITWSDPQQMSEDALGCAKSIEFVTGSATDPQDPLYLLLETHNQVFLSTWNGLQWSRPKVQSILSGFEDPEIYTEVIYSCHRTSLLEERLFVIGCDQGVGSDVWVTSRDLESNASWFETLEWNPLLPVTSGDLETETVELVATGDGLVHAFVSLHQDPAIYYTSWNGELWSRFVPVLILPDGVAGRPEIAAGPENGLFLIAQNNRGALYFSRATSGDAVTESRWSTPIRLGIDHDGMVGSAAVAWDADGTLHVAYSVPVNDERGIYLIQSKDHGTSWSEPLQVFDGEAAGFDLVGAPSILVSENGILHITWRQQSIQGDGESHPLSLYYTRSENGGRTFSEGEIVVEEPVAWREIVADSGGNLHLLWQPQDMFTTVWDQVSSDGGRSWQFPQGLPSEGIAAGGMVDSVGRLHFVNAGPGSLSHWVWDGVRWQPESSLLWPLTLQQEGPVELLTAVVNGQGIMVVVLALPADSGAETEGNLLYTTRMLELPSEQSTIQNVPTQMPITPTVISPTFTPELIYTPSSTIDSELTDPQDQTTGNESSDPISPFIMALVPVALLLLGVLGIMLRRSTRVEDR